MTGSRPMAWGWLRVRQPGWGPLRVRPRRAQLRTRVLAGVVLITLVALAGFDLAAITALRGYLMSQTDSELQNALVQVPPAFGVARRSVQVQVPAGKFVQAPPGRVPQRVASAPGSRKVVPRISFVGPAKRLPPILDQYYFAYVTGRGPRVILDGNPNLVPELSRQLRSSGAAQLLGTVPSANGKNVLRVLSEREPGGRLVVTTSLGHVNSTVSQLALIVIIGSAVAGALVAAGVGLVMRRGLRPIETMATRADRISAGDLTDRVSPHDPRSEVGRLGAALNGMLTRIEASLQQREADQALTRQFFADASHELRNPLASLRANAELYEQGALATRPQVDEAMHRIAFEAQRMSGLVDDMLRLARLDQHPGQHNDSLDLTALLADCVERCRITEPDRTVHTQIAPGLKVTGDEELLRRAVGNLLANVCAHTPREAVATVVATPDAGGVTVAVGDDGPGVPGTELAHIFDRFYRSGTPGRRPGSGLGLAIVAAIAHAHHGTAAATLNDPHGLTITLTLPT